MVALITGGSSGMGLEFARGLASRGCELVLVSNREEELASASAALSAEFPVKVRTRFQDLAKPLAADELYEWSRGEDILPDVLVNDAGMFFFGNAMKQRGSGYILNVSSMAARIPAPGITV